VVEVGLTLVVPFAEVEENAPGAMATVVAPGVFQLSVLLAPELIPVGLAVKEVIVGSELFSEESEEDEIDEPQPANAPHTHKIRASPQERVSQAVSSKDLNFLLERNLAEFMRTPSVRAIRL
jgi:hypothetical protein